MLRLLRINKQRVGTTCCHCHHWGWKLNGRPVTVKHFAGVSEDLLAICWVTLPYHLYARVYLKVPWVVTWGIPVVTGDQPTPRTWIIRVVAWTLLWVITWTTNQVIIAIHLGSSPRLAKSVTKHQPALLLRSSWLVLLMSGRCHSYNLGSLPEVIMTCASHEWSLPFMQPWVVSWGHHDLYFFWVVVTIYATLGRRLRSSLLVCLMSGRCHSYNLGSLPEVIITCASHEWSLPFMQLWVVAWGHHNLCFSWVVVAILATLGRRLRSSFSVTVGRHSLINSQRITFMNIILCSTICTVPV